MGYSKEVWGVRQGFQYLEEVLTDRDNRAKSGEIPYGSCEQGFLRSVHDLIKVAQKTDNLEVLYAIDECTEKLMKIARHTWPFEWQVGCSKCGLKTAISVDENQVALCRKCAKDKVAKLELAIKDFDKRDKNV